MAINLMSFLKEDNFTVFVNFKSHFRNAKSSLEQGFILDNKVTSLISVEEYLKNNTRASSDKIIKLFKLVKLKESILTESLKYLTPLELKKVYLAEVLLLKSKIIICEYFFRDMINEEKDYFRRLLRNLIYKQKIKIILIENDMNFICETVKEFYLFTKNEKCKLITDFYNEEIYKYVPMPHTVEIIKYLEECGYEIEHEITFNETLKAIYRGVAWDI